MRLAGIGGTQEYPVHVWSDLVMLFTAVAASYVAMRAWRYATSAATVSQVGVRTYTEVVNNVVRAINESDDIWVKLWHIQMAIDTVKGIGQSLPAEAEIHYQLRQLEDIRTALSNDALRFRLSELLTRLRSAADDKQKLTLGQEMLSLLEQEKGKQAADPRLIVHYETIIQEHVEKLEHASMPTEELEDQRYHDYVSEFLDVHNSLLDFSLDNDMPEGVCFFERMEIALPGTCGQAIPTISFEINGEQIDPDGLDDVLGKSILQTIHESMHKRIGSTRCPRHGSAPSIVIRGDSLSDLSWQAPRCCQQLRDAVNAKLHNH